MTTVKDIADEIVALQSRKNADYGNAFGLSMQEFGLTAPAIRLTDKLNRFKSLIKKEAEVKTESIEDTLIDLAAYAMMTMVEMRNGKIDTGRNIKTGDRVRLLTSTLDYEKDSIGIVVEVYESAEVAEIEFEGKGRAVIFINKLEKV